MVMNSIVLLLLAGDGFPGFPPATIPRVGDPHPLQLLRAKKVSPKSDALPVDAIVTISILLAVAGP